jgi:hypothetical protein
MGATGRAEMPARSSSVSSVSMAALCSAASTSASRLRLMK